MGTQSLQEPVCTAGVAVRGPQRPPSGVGFDVPPPPLPPSPSCQIWWREGTRKEKDDENLCPFLE